jgi:Xaa-Pro aminopeptidase
MGFLPTVAELSAQVGVENTATLSALPAFLKNAIDSRRNIHFCKPYRADIAITLSELLGLKLNAVDDYASKELHLAVIKQRSVKSPEEIVEIEKAMAIAHEMQTTAMKMAKDDSLYEHHIAGRVEGIT